MQYVTVAWTMKMFIIPQGIFVRCVIREGTKEHRCVNQHGDCRVVLDRDRFFDDGHNIIAAVEPAGVAVGHSKLDATVE